MGWKMVLRKEPRGARVVSCKDSMLDIGCISLGNIEEHCGLVPTSLENDATPTDPILDEVVVLSTNEVVVALNRNEHEPSYEDEDEFGIEEDENAQID
jgi:hypothetical protein